MEDIGRDVDAALPGHSRQPSRRFGYVSVVHAGKLVRCLCLQSLVLVDDGWELSIVMTKPNTNSFHVLTSLVSHLLYADCMGRI